MKRLIGIYREQEFSPGRHQSNDSLLLEAIAQRLRSRGCPVDLISAPNGNGKIAPHDAALVFSMCQGRHALLQLAEWERAGVTVLNRPAAALNTHRDHLPMMMARGGIPFPKTELLETSPGANRHASKNGGGLWLKRGDVHASIGADVQWLSSSDQLEQAMEEFSARGITQVAVQAHCPGDEIKFYGVGEAGFFHWFYSRCANRFTVNEEALRHLASRAAAAAGLTIFGGDVIVDEEGNLTLIDLNDWPSFAPCRKEASDAIATLIWSQIHAP